MSPGGVSSANEPSSSAVHRIVPSGIVGILCGWWSEHPASAPSAALREHRWAMPSVIKASHGDRSCLILSSIESRSDGRSIVGSFALSTHPLPAVAASWPAIKIMLSQSRTISPSIEAREILLSPRRQRSLSLRRCSLFDLGCNATAKDFAPATSPGDQLCGRSYGHRGVPLQGSALR